MSKEASWICSPSLLLKFQDVLIQFRDTMIATFITTSQLLEGITWSLAFAG
uniref:Uncharacterized protein n=1 Tax=Manihot esculenta TaxID=3983 RepID=A0A2C9VX87_MANES